MAELWAVGLATAAVSAGATVYAANQQKKGTENAAKTAAAGQQGNSHIELPPPPDFKAFDYWGLNPQVVAADKYAYAESDADFRRRHKPTVQAEKLFETSMLRDQQGEHELTPALQNEFMRSGMVDALQSFNAPGTLAEGSAGEANVARNLGLSILGFQDRTRANRMQSLDMAERIFPRRQIGMNGSDLAAALQQKNLADNQIAQQAHGQRLEELKYNSGIDIGNNTAAIQQANANAQAKAQSDAEMAKALGSAVSGLATAGGNAYSQYRSNSTTSALPPSRIVGSQQYSYSKPGGHVPVTTGSVAAGIRA